MRRGVGPALRTRIAPRRTPRAGAAALMLGTVLGVVGHGRNALAADVTDVASSFDRDRDNIFDFRFGVRYDHTEKRALITREREGANQDRVLVFRDLAYAQRRDTMTLRADVGIYQDLMLTVELPLIFRDSGDYHYDQSRGDACIYPPQLNANCINADNSSTVQDGIVAATGFDATHQGAATGGNLLFQGAARGGLNGGGGDWLDTINLGLTWAPVNQKRDDTKPTWTIGAEAQVSIGTVMALDRARPSANHGISEGIHRFFFRTMLSRRFRFFEPYAGFWYMLPVARDDSLFRDYGPAQRTKSPQQRGGASFGFEAIPFERPKEGHKIALDARARIEGHFNGLGYSEAWELLASSPALACGDAMSIAYNPACDVNAVRNAYQNQAFTGITNIESYATLGLDVAASAHVGNHAVFRAEFDYSHDQSHLITGDDVGVPQTASGRVMTAGEFNPAYRQVIDQVGRRYRVDDVNVYVIMLRGELRF